MKSEPMKFRKVSELHPLPENPRTINKADLDRLVDSIRINGFWEHRPLAIVEREGKFIVLCGNQRLKAAKRCKVAEVPTVLYTDVTPEEEADLILRDNINNGEWDYNALQVETTFADVNFDFIGLSFPSEEVGRCFSLSDFLQLSSVFDEHATKRNQRIYNEWHYLRKEIKRATALHPRTNPRKGVGAIFLCLNTFNPQQAKR